MADLTQKLGFDASQGLRSLGKLRDRLREVNTEMRKMGGLGAKNGLKGVQKEADKTKKKTKELTLSWKTMARQMASQTIVQSIRAIGAAFVKAVQDATEFRLAIAEIQTIGGDLAMTNDEIARSVKQLSSELGKSAGDVAEGLYQTLSNQVVEASDAMGFLETAQKLAIVTHGQTKDAVNALSSVMNSYGMEAREAGHVAGTLFKTVEEGRLRLSDMANIIGRVTPLTAKMGVTWEETAASIATMTRQGVRADTAVTQLRAVMQKLIKPTDAMREIFQKWGVKDGPQAIKTFGGLQKVLEKLAEETGHNDQEMAELFRRVRSIVGVFSILNKEGKTMTQVMEEMAEATDAADKAWEQYSATDAHKLTASMQELKNVMLSLGEAAIPFVEFLATGTAKIIRGMDGIRKATLALMSDTIRAEYTIREQREQTKDQIEALRDVEVEHRKKLEETYETGKQAAYEWIAAVAIAENEVRQLHQDGLDNAAAAMKGAGSQLVSFYGDAIKTIEDFIQQSKSAVKDAAKANAEIESQIQDNQLKTRLEGTKGTLNKMRVLEQASARARQKSAEAFGKIDTSKESHEAALAANDREKALADQNLQLAKQTGHQYTIQRAAEAVNGVLRKRQAINTAAAASQKKAQAQAVKDAAQLKAKQAEYKSAIEEIQKLQESGALESKDAGVKSAAEARLKQLKTFVKSAAEEIANNPTLKTLGKAAEFKELGDNLQAAFDATQFDWKREVARLNATLESDLKPIKLAADKSGVREAGAGLMGFQEREGEGVADRQRRIIEEAATLESTQDTINSKVKEEAKVRRDGLNSANNILQGMIKDVSRATIADKAQAAGKQAYARAGNGYTGGPGFGGSRKDVKEAAAAQERAEKATARRLVDEQNLKQALEDNIALVNEGVVLEAGVTKQLLAQVAQQRLKHGLSVDNAAALSQVVRLIEEGSQANERAAKLENTGYTEQQQEGARMILEDTVQQGEQQKKNSDIQATANSKVAEYRNALNGVKQSQGEVATKTGETATNTHNAAQGGQNLATSGQTNTGIWTAVSGIVSHMANEYERAARASQQIKPAGGGEAAAQYMGGPMRYFAQGGAARGQDKINTMLARGETVINSRNSRRFYSELNAMNQGSKPVYREQGGPVTNVGDVNVTVKGGDSSQQTVREIGNALRREIKRGTIKLS